jgi:large subunit ribosomal protein L29
MKLAEIRLLSSNELKAKLADARQELMNLRFQMVNGQLTDTSRMRQMRQQIAQFETVLRARELGMDQEVQK